MGNIVPLPLPESACEWQKHIIRRSLNQGFVASLTYMIERLQL